MSIIERIASLDLPSDQSVVIGSGVMDALGLREARDIDLVVTPAYFEQLRTAGGWAFSLKHGEEVAEKDDVEVWLSWGSDGLPNFNELYRDGITIQGIRFADPAFVKRWKEDHPNLKNNQDVILLEEYLQWQK